MTKFRKSRIGCLNNKGLTLVEVMVSVTIFAIMIVPIVTQMNTLLKQNYTAKLSQAETDYAARVMEQFKELNSDTVDVLKDDDGNILLNGGMGKTKAGYSVDVSDEDAYIYSMEDIKLEQDIDANATSVVRNGTTYTVEVKLDSAAYETSKGTNAPGNSSEASTEVGDVDYSYKDPNSTDYYNLENIDDRFCVMVRENSGNYDARAAEDLIDKIALKLKTENEKRYNLWLNGVDILKKDTYNKNTYVKVSYDSAAKKYYATVTISYTDKMYNQTVSYILMNNKEYDPSQTNNKPPAVYIFYNQFVQNNRILSGSDTITIDNSGLATGGRVTSKNALRCYLIKGEVAAEGEYTYYQRKTAEEGGGDEVIGSTTTNNTAGSYVYVVKENGVTSYLWPSFVVDSDYYDSYQNGDSNGLDTILGGMPSAVNYYDENGMKTKYVYNNVLVPASITGAVPSSSEYTMGTGNGYYSYICSKKTQYNGVDVEPGEIVYQRAAHEYVWPNGDVSKTPPSTDYFTICTPSKMSYNDKAGVNVLFTSDSVPNLNSGKNAITIFSNIEKANMTSSTSNVSPIISTGSETSVGGGATTVSYQTIDLDKYIKSLTEDKLNNGAKRLYHVTLQLYKVTGSEKKKILSLESGKEG